MKSRLAGALTALALALTLTTPLTATTSTATAAAKPKTSVSLKVSDHKVKAGKKVTVRGKVTPRVGPNRKARTVVLQAKIGAGWKKIGRKLVGARGYSFTFKARADAKKYRVKVPKARNLKGATKSFKVKAKGKPTNVTAAFSATNVKIGASVVVRGTIKGDKGGRTVRLLRKLPGGKRPVRSTRSASDGTWEIAVPTDFLVNHPLFVRVEPSKKNRGVASSPQPFVVSPHWALRGDATHWKPIVSDGYQVRMNPCAPVAYRINYGGMPVGEQAGARADLEEAMRRTTQATGITFSYKGSSTFVPKATTSAHQKYPKDVRLVVTWAIQRETSLDLTATRAWGGGGGIYTNDTNGRRVIERTQGYVLFGRPEQVPAGFANVNQRGAVLMHELAHVLGLDHAAGADMIMSINRNSENPATWGRGDLTGLRAKGLDQGCLAGQARYRGIPKVYEGDDHPAY